VGKQQSPYEVLGVREDAPWREIASAYRQKAQQYHPDKMVGLAQEFQALAEERMKEVNAAYSALKRQGKYKSADAEQSMNDRQDAQAEHPSARTSSAAAEAYFDKGQHCLDARRYEEAIELLTRTLRLQPDFTPAYLSLAIAYGSLLRRTEQIEALKQAIRLQPDFAWAHAFLGLAYVQIGETAAAVREYEILKTLDPALAEKLPPSLRELRSSPAAPPVTPPLEPRVARRKALLIPAGALTLLLLLLLVDYLGRGRDNLSPLLGQDVNSTASSSEWLQDPLAAIGRQYVLELISYTETEGGVNNEKKILEVKGRIEELQLKKPIEERHKQQVEALVNSGLAHLREQRFREAISAFQAAAQPAPGVSEILEHLGEAYLRNNDLAEAQHTLLLALVLSPQQTQTWVLLGQAYARIGNPTAAVACFANAYRFSNNREETRQALRQLAEKETADAAVQEAVRQALRLQFLRPEGRARTEASESSIANGPAVGRE
jgi:tetratricopeptide (TPR) repeat protein